MKRFYIIAAILLCAGTVAHTQESKLNPAGRILVQKQRTVTSRAAGDTHSRTGAIVRLNPGFTSEVLLSVDNLEIVTDLGDIVTVKVPVEALEQIAAMPEVKSVSAGNKRRPHLNVARGTGGVDEAHSGIETPAGGTTSYTGRGTVVGFMDGGIDPNHLNFKNSDGTSRVKRLWHFAAVDDYSYEYTTTEYTDTNIATFTTDDSDETHATHVAGIIGGSYSGSGTYVDQTTRKNVTGNIPFRGVAYEADFAMSCGDFLDDCIINGVSNIIDYAASVGKPAAINLSLGSNYGPHDGTDDFSAALSRLGEKALISVSAGNEGSDNMSIQHTFTSATTPLKTILFYNNEDYNVTNVDGILDIWADDDSPLTVTISTVNSSGTLTQRGQTTRANQTVTLNSTSKGVKAGGEITMYSLIDPNNGRYNVYLYFSEALPTTGRFAITVQGAKGQKVDMFFSGYTEFTDRYNASSSPLSGFTAGTPDYSINSMVCGPNVLAVGSYNTSVTSWKTLSSTDSFGETANEISSFSSYGTDFNGRKLPQIAAPGSAIASSYSRRYVAKGYSYESAAYMVGSAANGSNTEYWGMMQGTSMAAPFATGTMALWLQADPTLTHADVLDVLEHSSTSDSYTKAAPDRFGYGKINAAEGLRYILAKASIGSVTADGDRPVLVTPVSDGFEVTMPGEAAFTVTLTDMQGRQVLSRQFSDGTATLRTDGILHGIYILTARGAATTHTQKVAVR